MNKIWKNLQNKIIKTLKTKKMKKNIENNEIINYDKNNLNNKRVIYKIEDLSDSNIQQIINEELYKVLVNSGSSHFAIYSSIFECLYEDININCSRT